MNDLQREKFEKWFKNQIDSEYCSPNVKEVMFECWCAAIESVVVEQQKPVNPNQCLACGGYHGSGNLPCPLMQFTCLGS